MHRMKIGTYLIMLLAFIPRVGSSAIQTIEVPPFATTLENVSLAFAPSTFDAIAISGEPNGPIRMTVSHGTITMGAEDGIVFVEGDGIDDARCVFSGRIESVNNALSRLIFTPPPNYAGRATITIEADEQTAILQIAVNRPIDAETARDDILSNVQSIHGGGQPGFVVAYGRAAHDIAFYEGGAADGTAVVAAGWGAGRVIALPDHQALNMHNYGQESGQFYRNAITWLSRAGLDVRLVTLSAEVAAWLQSQGYQNVFVANNNGLADALSRADVFIPPWLGANVNQRVLDTVGQFVRSGGALLICDYGVGYDWWWRKPIHEAPGNILLREAGIGFVDGNRWEAGVVELMRADGSLNAAQLVQMLDDPNAFDAAEKERGGALLGKIYDALAPVDPLTQRLDAAFGDAVDSIRPTPAAPVTSAWEKALLTREIGLLRRRPANELSAHRSADAVFGRISEDAPRIRRVITIDPRYTRWHSTGLYGAPGELITATIPAEVQDAGIVLRFGGHTDNISVRDEWKRPPQVHWSWPLDSDEVVAASPFGGALYIDVGTENREQEPFDVVLEGAVAAPQFVLGETSDEDWNNGIRGAPAPFAEMISEHAIISLPSSLIRTLDNPTAVMTFWNDVVRLQDELGSHSTRRYMAERINIDVQVSYGYLHAGYPTQGPTVSAENLMNLDHLRATGSWGWFHELGHEAQRRPDKSWGGTTRIHSITLWKRRSIFLPSTPMISSVSENKAGGAGPEMPPP